MAPVPLSTRLEMGRLWILSVGMYAGALLKIALGKRKEGEFDIELAKANLKQTSVEPR